MALWMPYFHNPYCHCYLLQAKLFVGNHGQSWCDGMQEGRSKCVTEDVLKLFTALVTCENGLDLFFNLACLFSWVVTCSKRF